jgi:WD40 repeat protein
MKGEAEPQHHLRRIDNGGDDARPLIIPVVGEDRGGMDRRGFLRFAAGGVSAASLILSLDGQSLADNLIPPKEAEGRTLGAHCGAVNDLAFSADGSLLISASDDRTIKLWSMNSLEVVDRITDHSAQVRHLAVAPNGRKFAAAALERTAMLWGLPAPGDPIDLRGHLGDVSALAFSPDSRWLATGAFDRAICLWDLADEDAAVPRMRGHAKPITAMAFTPDQAMLLSASGDGTVRRWSVEKSNLTATLQAHEGFVSALVMSPRQALAVSGGNDKCLCIWDVGKAKLRRRLKGHAASIRCLALSRDGRLIASGSNDRTARLWSLPEEKHLATLGRHRGFVTCLAFTPDGRHLVTGGTDCAIRIWSTASGKLVHTCRIHRKPVDTLTISPDGGLLAAGDQGGVVTIWDLGRMRFRTFLFDPDANHVATQALTYRLVNEVTRQPVTYTMAKGVDIPQDATCICNTVHGKIKTKVLELSAFRPRPVPYTHGIRPTRNRRGRGTDSSSSSSGGSSGGGGGLICTCNTICICVPVCQAHRLLHPDPAVRAMARQLVLLMGIRQWPYLCWARDRAVAPLRQRIAQLMRAVMDRQRPELDRCPDVRACVARLNDPDEVIAIMSAQVLRWRSRLEDRTLPDETIRLISANLGRAAARPWYLRANA